MLKNPGIESIAFALISMGLIAPIALPEPGSAMQRPHDSFSSKRPVIANNIVQKLQKEGNFRLFLSSLKDTGMDTMLETQRGPFTVFAPNDRAFASLSKDSFTKLFEDKTRLKSILRYHIVAKKVTSSELKFDSLRTLSGDFLMTNVNGARAVTVSGGLVNKPDIMCRNGVVHSIDTVLFPLNGMENLAMLNPSKAGRTEVR